MQTFAKKSGEYSSGRLLLSLGWSDSILRLSQMKVFFLLHFFLNG
jgi:hypothetical protein